MTNHWIDIGNSDCIMVIGSNAAENHPVSMKWVTKAKDKGAKLISVDPRFTRTSAVADIYAPLRSGTDIAFIGAIINYALEHDLVNRDYLVNHTNASFVVNSRFRGLLDNFDGTFGEIQGGSYTKDLWKYQSDGGRVRTDRNLQNSNCVYQLLKKHFARYTFEKASAITGCPVDMLKKVAETYCATYVPDKSATIMYAMGTTQHTHGTQNIRSYVILQLLMGNIGVAGGGINALRGESNVQGSTDHCLLFHILPGYLKCPTATDANLDTYLRTSTPSAQDKAPDPGKSLNWWKNYKKYTVSLLKAFWGDHATASNDFAYSYLPKRGANYSHIALFEAMEAGTIKGLFILGQNPAVAGPNAFRERNAMDKLDWLVAADLWNTETMDFWRRPGADPANIKTEVFMLPAASSVEKEGSVVNSGRWAQWRYQAVHPPGDAKSDLWMLDRLHKELKKLYAQGGTFPDPIVQLSWNYGDKDEPDPHLVAKEINGYHLSGSSQGKLVKNFTQLADDGSTLSGNWLYCGSYNEDGNLMARRIASGEQDDPIGLNLQWSWCWPVNRRIIYNRASCDRYGRPYAPHKPVIAWNSDRGGWDGDIPDGGAPPMADGGYYSFIMRPEGHACLFAAPGLVDGPFPEHYEPLESPVDNLMSGQQNNPVIRIWRPEEVGDRKDFPIVATTYRVTEHWQAGAMTRSLTWLTELVPEPFVEMSEELAQEKGGIRSGDIITIRTARGEAGLRALVTKRLKPFKINGTKIHEVGIIWHFGYCGIARGTSANEMTPHVGDANTMIPEYKAFLCDVRKGGALCEV